jgi:large subunit ribosomal protein L10
MNKQEKAVAIDALAGALKTAPTTFVLAPRGLTVNQVTLLRRKVRASAGQFRVVKNRLALRALKETPLAPLAPHFTGETAIATSASDPSPLARVLDEFARDHQGLTIKGGMVDGRLVGIQDIKAIADMPPRPVLIVRLLGALKQPMTRLVRVLKEPHRGMVRTLDEITRTKRGGGASPAVPEPPAP